MELTNMDSVIIRKVWVIKGLVDYDGVEMVRYVGSHMSSARVKTIANAWAFASYEEAFGQLRVVLGEGTFEIIPIFVKTLVEVKDEGSGGTTVPPKVEKKGE